MRRRLLVLWTAGLCLWANAALAQAPAPPPAQPDGNKELAKIWANKAKSRYDAADYRGALEAIHEAEKHARPPTFTRLEAQATEKLGKLVEAQRLYQAVIDFKLTPGAPPAWVSAQESSRKDLAALAPRVPKIQIVVSGIELSTLTITLDGAPLDTSALGRPLPQDPGAHEVSVTAPGKQPMTKTAVLREGVTEQLLFEIEAAKPGGEPQGGRSAPFRLPPAVLTATKFAALGLGGAGLLAGAISGGWVAGQADELNSVCRLDLKKCHTRSQKGVESVGALADFATASLVVGGVGAAAGVLLLVLPGKTPAKVGVSVSPGFITVRGVF